MKETAGTCRNYDPCKRIFIFPGRGRDFSLRHRIQTGSGAHPAFSPVGKVVSSSGDTAVYSWSWPLTSM